MDVSLIPTLQLQDDGVTFKYLVLKFTSDGEEKTLLRGINFRPYETDAVQQIVNWTWDELEALGFREGRDVLAMDGGGTLSLNPYYETATLFGELPGVGAESDRDNAAQMVQEAFPDHKVEWFPPEVEVKKPVKKRPPPRKAAAAGDDEEPPEDDASADDGEE